jgi:hypothetical protein
MQISFISSLSQTHRNSPAPDRNFVNVCDEFTTSTSNAARVHRSPMDLVWHSHLTPVREGSRRQNVLTSVRRSDISRDIV